MTAAAAIAAGNVVAHVRSVSTKRYGRDTVRSVVIKCPFCNRRRTHGWPAGDEAPGWRRPHCGIGNLDRTDYYIAASAAQLRKAA